MDASTQPLLTETAAFRALATHYQRCQHLDMRELFAQDEQRFARFSLSLDTLLLDYSKNRLHDDTRQLLVNLATERGIPQHIEDLFSGAKINTSEQRAALHTALRQQSSHPIWYNGNDVTTHIEHSLQHMAQLCQQVHQQRWLGFNQQPITDIVNIGIGGSDLGPRMVTEALQPYATPSVRVHFVSNIDGTQITRCLQHLNPATTLFVIVSKSFTTLEVLTNADSAKKWLCAACDTPEALRRHFIAVTAERDRALAYGIADEHIVLFWDFVGGRFSLWSAAGLSIAFALGMPHFNALLAGAKTMDQHFRRADLINNMPVLLALIGIWYINFFGVHSYAILPYDEMLRRLPDYLQQLDMESNGKRVNHNGQALPYATSPSVWGSVGCNGQHAFHQHLHQSTHFIPIDFLIPARSHYPLDMHHTLLMANCLSQSRTLMLGSDPSIEMLEPHRYCPGNRPSNTVLFEKLDPHTLGMLLALYEHKIAVQGKIWGINSFDQWGVTLGKQAIETIAPTLQGTASAKALAALDASTQGLIAHYQKHSNSD